MVEPEEAAVSMAAGFMEHDAGRREESVKSFSTTDTFQFPHLSEDDAYEAAEAYVDALWAKDDAEQNVGEWGDVLPPLERRAEIVEADERYAALTKRAWKAHKNGEDYWTPLMQAQVYEARAALQDDEYPRKDRGGQNGFGPLPPLYLFGVEIHDTRQYDLGVDIMTEYFEIMQEIR